MVLLLTASSSFAQTTRYIDRVNGKRSGNCTDVDPTSTNGPCKLVYAYTIDVHGDVFLFRVSEAGSTVEILTPTPSLDKRVRFGAYEPGGKTPVEGVLKFTRNFNIAAAGQVQLHEKAKIEFAGGVTVSSGSRGTHQFFLVENGSEERITIADTLTLGQSATLDRLVVSKSFAVEGTLIIDQGLTVKSGAVLTVGGTFYIYVKKGDDKDDPKGMVTVDGEIKSSGDAAIILAYPKNGRGDGSHFISRGQYKPDKDGKVDHEDCFRIRGSGTVNSPVRMLAVGNICVEVKKFGRFSDNISIAVVGSIQEGNTERQNLNITTDLIFRDDVVVEGIIEQWNDARIVFEKTATIKGNVILRDGVLEDNFFHFFPNYFGIQRVPGGQVRKGVKMETSDTEFTCEYFTKRTDDKGRGTHIPGVQFEDEVTIEGNLDVRSDEIVEVTSHATQSSTRCAPRVLFMAPPAKTKRHTVSEIDGGLVIEDNEDFKPGGRVYLDYDSLKTGEKITHETTHSLHVGGGITASGTAIGMGHSKTLSNAGMCGATKVTLGNEIVLTGAGSHVINGALTLGMLSTANDLVIRNGPLTVKHLHVRSGGELTSSDDVKIDGGALILEGDGLQGTLADGSVITHLVYGSRDTDLVPSGALVDTLDLTIDVGDGGELRLDQVTKTKNLGLCSGTLVLREAGTETESTLSVHEQITVKNGRLKKDTGSIATDANRYHLKYITPGKLTVEAPLDLEWFNPQDVTVDHRSAEIMVEGARSLMGALTVTNGKLIVDGMVTAANVTLSNASELHTEEDKVVVNGKVTLNGTSKLMTDGGDVNVLGQVRGGKYTNNTAGVTVEAKAKIDLGTGTLMLGPEDTATRAAGATRPDVKLMLHGDLVGSISVPKGSKETTIDAATIPADSMGKTLGMIMFDGQMPSASGTSNSEGTLRLLSTAEKPLMVDSLSAMNGTVEFKNKKVTILKDVHLRSATISPYSEATEFKGNLTLSGTGGFSTLNSSATDTLSVVIRGDFRQNKGEMTDSSGVNLQGKGSTIKTVMGDFMVAKDAAPYTANKMSTLVLEGDFHHMKEDTLLHAKLEFKGEEAQEVKTGRKTELDSVVVDNAKGLRLASSVTQRKTATLTLRRGRIMNADTTAMAETRTWTLMNPQIEENLKGRTSALESKKCGPDEDEVCKFSISRGSRQSHASVPFTRHLEHGNSGEGAVSGGYLFPVGLSKEQVPHYRPLILQLPFDLSEADSATVSLVMVPEGTMPEWTNLTVPGSGGESLTLDVHSDLFWKIETGAALESEVNVRVVAAGLPNVSDVKGLRIVQWDCDWKKPKLAGRYNASSTTGSFGVNDVLNGVVNLTQERITLEACTILGIAANGIENPIDQAELTGGRARLQFIHNLPLPAPVDLHLGDIRIRSGLSFQEATAYRTVGVGSYELTIQPDGVPEEQVIKASLPALRKDRNYVVIAHGSVADPKIKFMETQFASSIANKVDAILVHGSGDLGPVDVRILDASDNMTPLMTLADNIPFDGKTSYRSLDASMHNVQVSSPTNAEEYEVFQMDLHEYGNETLVLNLSGSRSDLAILGVDKNGTTFLPDVITGVETEGAELPTEFALHGNYPNPFNPSTRIRFDLPETAQVRVQIVDMLGREVMSLPAQEFEAGANRSMEINAMNLASGTYLYRMIVTGAEERHVKTGRMTLVK